MMRAALRYARAGLRVIPVRGKRKLPTDWPSLATTSPEQIRAWWSGPWRGANVAVVTGRESGVFVLDVDVKDDQEGDISLAALVALHGELPDTKQGLTGSGGLHYWFLYPSDGREVRNKQGFRQGLDIRGEGGYVVVPPSVHPETGQPYEWDVTAGELAIAAAPDWLIDMVKQPAPAPRRVREADAEFQTTRYGRRILDRLCGEMAASATGRNEKLNRCAFEAGQYVGGREIAYEDARTELEDAALQAAAFGPNTAQWLDRGGLKSIITTLERGLESGQASPRAAPKREPAPARQPAPAGPRSEDEPPPPDEPPDGPPGPDPPWLEPPDDDEKPTIIVQKDDFDNLVRQMERVVIANAGHRLFARAGEIVKVFRDFDELEVSVLGSHTMQLEADRAANWRSYGRKGKLVKCDAPHRVADMLLQERQWDGLRPLRGVTTTPIIRLDGTVLETPGYDDPTGIYYDPCGVEYPSCVIEGDPLRCAQEAATELSENLLSGFQFVDDESHSVAMAALLTSVARPGLPTAPMFLFDAYNRDSGKSHLASVVTMLGGGREYSPMAPTNHEETEKRIMASLAAGDRFFEIDNNTGPLGNNALEVALTSPGVKGRDLGKTKRLKYPQRMMFIGTGNRTRFAGDMARRVLGCRLEQPAGGFDPSLDPLPVARARRGHFVVVALRIMAAYAKAGRPALSLPGYSSYGAWSQAVRFPLVWAGFPDPLLSQRHFNERDQVTSLVRVIIEQWHEQFGEVPKLASDVTDELTRESAQSSERCFWRDLQELHELTRGRGTLGTRQLGRVLGGYVSNVPHNGLILRRSHSRVTGGYQWFLAEA